MSKTLSNCRTYRSHCRTLTAASGLWPDTVSGSGWGTHLTHVIHSGSVKRTFNSSAYSVAWMTNPEVKQRRQFSLSWLWVTDHRVHRDCPSPLCSPQTRSDSKATTTLCQHSPASTSSAPPTLLLPPSCACVITWSESPLPSPNSVNQECVSVCVCVSPIFSVYSLWKQSLGLLNDLHGQQLFRSHAGRETLWRFTGELFTCRSLSAASFLCGSFLPLLPETNGCSNSFSSQFFSFVLF